MCGAELLVDAMPEALHRVGRFTTDLAHAIVAIYEQRDFHDAPTRR